MKIRRWNKDELQRFKGIVRSGGDATIVRSNLLAAMQELRPASGEATVTRYCSRYARHLLNYEKRRMGPARSVPASATQIPVRIGKWSGTVDRATAKAMLELLVDL